MEASRSAEELGVRAGMPIGEAIARYPSLGVFTADPMRAARIWEGACCALEAIGAAVEANRQGEAFFEVDGLCGLYGEIGDVLARARDSVRLPVRIAAAPGRFAAALAAADRDQLRAEDCDAERIISEACLLDFLRPHTVTVLYGRLGFGDAREAELIVALERLGIETLGQLAAIGVGQIADRFGKLGQTAFRLAQGDDDPIRPRQPQEELTAEIELYEGAAGPQLDRALELLVDRLLADRLRRRRTILAVRLSAPLSAGGSWSTEQRLGRPTASAKTIFSLLSLRMRELPGPARALRLQVLAFGPEAADQLRLEVDGVERRRQLLAAAIREVRSVAGPSALLRVIDREPSSRVPERRFMLTPRRE